SDEASDSGGVKVSSTTSSSLFLASRPSFMAFTDDNEAAVLSVSMATVLGRLPEAFSARSRIIGSAMSACRPAVAEVWKMYLKPREVIWSEYDRVSMGSLARSVTSVTARVNELRYAPVPATRSG